MSIQQMLLGVGGKKKTYLDDVFSTYLYRGTGSNRTITNGIDLSGEGGMVYTKRLNGGVDKYGMLWDTINGGGKRFITSYNSASGGANTQLSGFTTSGFTLGTDGDVNANNSDFGSWSFRKAPGFFDMVKYTGNGAQNHQISHNLGCVPGMIIIKNMDSAEDWFVYHRDMDYQYPEQYGLKLHSDAVRYSSQGDINNYAPTSTHFRLGTDTQNSSTNEDGDEYIAYLFGGGLPTTPKRTVWFDGSGDYLTTDANNDYQIGTGDFTLEYWIYVRANQVQFHVSDNSGGSMTWGTYSNSNGYQKFVAAGTDRIVSGTLPVNVWRHIAVVRNSGTTKMYIDGNQVGNSYTDSNNYSANQLYIGRRSDDTHYCNAHFSNVRLVVGTAVYTDNFIPPKTELTSITNTKLLCCNGTTVTSTTTGTLTSSGDPETVTNTPFSDPAGLIFGDTGDQEIIKCGSYRSSGAGNGEDIHVNIGWEPQWIMVKATDQGWDWVMLDNTRKMSTDGTQNKIIEINKHVGEDTGATFIKPNARGFTATASAVTNMFNNATNYIYVAIRCPDGYVSKPVETGTDVFAMDTGGSSAIIPAFDSNFPVDFAMMRTPDTVANWELSSRITGDRYWYANINNGWTDSGGIYQWDSNVGFAENSGFDSARQAWMWKRHAGFEVVHYIGDSLPARRHNLGKVPEMIWVKATYGDYAGNQAWKVYHKGLNDGSSPQGYYLNLNSANANAASSNTWNNTAPNATHFFVSASSNDAETNYQGNDMKYTAMLFASVSGVSKLGYYSGQDSDLTLDLGFQPRFFLTKRTDNSGSWLLFDTLRGMGSGNDSLLDLEGTGTAYESSDYVTPTSSGITLKANLDNMLLAQTSSNKHIYYAHA